MAASLGFPVRSPIFCSLTTCVNMNILENAYDLFPHKFSETLCVGEKNVLTDGLRYSVKTSASFTGADARLAPTGRYISTFARLGHWAAHNSRQLRITDPRCRSHKWKWQIADSRPWKACIDDVSIANALSGWKLILTPAKSVCPGNLRIKLSHRSVSIQIVEY